jgi:hypothetical protein
MISPSVAQAVPPANDDFDSAVTIASLPFSTTQLTTEATAALDDPTACYNNGSVWFSFTPATNMTIDANTFGSTYDTVLAAYTGSRGSLALVPGACNDDFSGTQSRIVFEATAGTTYYLMASQCCGYGGSGGGDLTLSVAAQQPPPNDDFANAMAIPGVPFTHTVDIVAATMQPGEPAYTCGSVTRSVWYAFTPTETGSVTARTSVGYNSILTVYTGSSLTELSQVACRSYSSPLTFRANAGQTYYLQVGQTYPADGLVQLNLDVAPAVTPSFYYWPSDPSTFDSVQFNDYTSDPGGNPIVTREWQFGDGTSGTGCCLYHRYAADGDYPVQLTVTTSDGRTGTASRVVAVRTHDVAFERFMAPESASVGQTRAVTAYVKNNRYDETVRVELYKSVPGGFALVGSLTQLVVARPNRTTEFPFNYTFTADDAALGKVTFKAVATIVNARDALTGDNTIISIPTTVR